MMPRVLVLLSTVLALPALANAASRADAFPGGADRILGLITYREGMCAVVQVSAEAPLKAGQVLTAGRPTKIRILRAGQESQRQWADWRCVGRITLRRKLGNRYWVADVTLENRVLGPNGAPAPFVRAGDMLHHPFRTPETSAVPAGTPNGGRPGRQGPLRGVPRGTAEGVSPRRVVALAIAQPTSGTACR